MLGPRMPMGGSSTSARSGRRSWSALRATFRLPGPNPLHSWRLIVLARGPAPAARGSAG
jgi:hypothetical protein